MYLGIFLSLIAFSGFILLMKKRSQKKQSKLSEADYLEIVKKQIEDTRIDETGIQNLEFVAVFGSMEELKPHLSKYIFSSIVYSNHIYTETITRWFLVETAFGNTNRYVVIMADTDELWADQFVYEILQIAA